MKRNTKGLAKSARPTTKRPTIFATATTLALLTIILVSGSILAGCGKQATNQTKHSTYLTPSGQVYAATNERDTYIKTYREAESILNQTNWEKQGKAENALKELRQLMPDNSFEVKLLLESAEEELASQGSLAQWTVDQIGLAFAREYVAFSYYCSNPSTYNLGITYQDYQNQVQKTACNRGTRTDYYNEVVSLEYADDVMLIKAREDQNGNLVSISSYEEMNYPFTKEELQENFVAFLLTDEDMDQYIQGLEQFTNNLPEGAAAERWVYVETSNHCIACVLTDDGVRGTIVMHPEFYKNPKEDFVGINVTEQEEPTDYQTLEDYITNGFAEEIHSNKVFYVDARSFGPLEPAFEGNDYEKLIVNEEYNDFWYLWSPRFALCDINQDGKMDVIVSGALGLRCKMLTSVCIRTANGFEIDHLDGQASSYAGNTLYLSDPDYGGAGAETYETEWAYSYDASGKCTEELWHEYSYCWYDEENDKPIDPVEEICNLYEIRGKEVTPEEYQEKVDSYGEWTAMEWHEITDEEIAKYLAPITD